MSDNALLNRAQPTWTYIPPSMSGRQVEGTSILPFGKYQMPDGSNQVSFGLPAPLLDAYRSMRQGLGYEQDPNAPQGFVSQEAIQRGANGLGVGAMVGSVPAGAAAALVQPGAAAASRSQLNSGFANNLGALARRLANTAKEGRNRALQRDIDDAIPYRTQSEPTGQLMDSKNWDRMRLAELHRYAEARMNIEEIASRIGTSQEDVARYIQRARRDGILGSRHSDKRINRQQNTNMKELVRQSQTILSRTGAGEKAQRILDRRTGARIDETPERLPPPSRQGGSLNSDDVPSFKKEVTNDQPAQITDDTASRSSVIEDVSTPAPEPKVTASSADKEKFWDALEGYLNNGGALPSKSGKGSNKAKSDFNAAMREAGVPDTVTSSMMSNRVSRMRNTGKEGKDLSDFIQTGRKSGSLKLSAGGGIPKDPTEPDAGDDFDHVTESGVVKVGDDD